MATNNQIKFYKGQNAPAAPAAGMIWFSTLDRTIRVYTGTEWEKYAGLVDASWNGTDKKLVITNAAGTTTTLDLSDCASASDISVRLTTINSTLADHDGRITAAHNAADAAAAAAATADGKAVKEAEERAKEIIRVEGLISAEATTARTAEEANAKAAKAAGDKAAGAQSYAEGVNTALGQEVTRATGEEARIAGLVSAEESRAKGVEDELRGLIGTAASSATTEVAKSDDATHITVTSSPGDNGQKIYTIGESDIASAQALANEIADRAADEEAIVNRIALLDAATTGRVSVLEGKVEALSSATHFLGVKADLPTTASNGDIVIVGSKEYVWDDNEDGTNILDKAGWIELGDTTAESGRITALEDLVGPTSVQSQISNAINDALLGLSDESKDSGDANLVKVTVNQSDGNVTGVVVDDTKLDKEFKSTNDAVALNTVAVANHKARIEALETTSNSLADTYVAKTDYAADKQAFEKKHADLQIDINAAKGRLDLAESDIKDLQAGTGLGDAAAPDYDGANYIAESATMVAADMALDAKIKELEDFKSSLNVGVTSVSGDADVNANPTTGDVSLSLNKATSVTSGDTKVVTASAVYEHLYGNNDDIQGALCWVEFN